MSSHDLRDTLATLDGKLQLGRGASSHRSYHVSLADLKETSVHIVGAAGYGKSFYLRHLIDQLVTHHQPFGLIDPHSELAQYALWRLRRSSVRPEKIIVLDPGDERYALGFNPLYCGITDPGEAASMVLEACLKAWGAASFDSTPRLERVLRSTLRLLVENNLTLVEAPDVLNVDNAVLRLALRESVSDEYVRQDLAELEKWPRAEKLAVLDSSQNRLRRFVQSERVQMMLGQRINALNLRHVMDSGQYLLADLGSISAPETQRLLGALLVNGIFHAAKQRDSRRPRHWWLICDEFGEFATRDFANSLDQLRKFGVTTVLGHQRLSQLQREDPDVASAVMTNAKIKIVFGGLERVEADRMARELFTGQVRGDRVKHITTQTKFRPILDTFEVETESFSESESESEGWGHSSGSGSGFSDNEGASHLDDGSFAIQDEVTRSQSRSESSSESSSDSDSGMTGSTSSRGHSTSRVPITRHEEFREESSRQFHSLDEEWERVTGILHGLPKRHALVRIYNGPVLHIVSPEIERERQDERSEQFQVKVMEQCPYVKPVKVVTGEIEERRKELTALTEAKEEAGRPFDVKSFRE